MGETRTGTLPVKTEAGLVAMETAFYAGSVVVFQERSDVSVCDPFPLGQILGGMCSHSLCGTSVHMYMCVHAHVHACVRATVLVAHTVKCTKLMEK